MDPIYGLLLAITALCFAVAIILAVHHETTKRYRLAQAELLQLHQQNNRLSWDNEMLHAEIKCIAIEYNIKSLPFRACRRFRHG